MPMSSDRARQFLGYGLVALAIVGLSLGSAFYFKEMEAKCEYLNVLREAQLKVERDESVLNDVQALLLKITSIKSDAEWYFEYAPVVTELQGFLDDAFLNVYERRILIRSRVQAVFTYQFCS
ncbi:hypothetical protein [Pseudomonas moorei]|uniref:hypothetical protein n=1 Tax=Pseudomonas moorei TaxID=395599 RepID=UPI00200DB735|nr:hypothetical protein [Pseudomonas moorei]